jgi:glycine C-acetyltransferase
VSSTLDSRLRDELAAAERDGTRKLRHVIDSPQGPEVEMQGHGRVLVMSSNDYLGLAGHPQVIQAGIEGLRRYGAGTASVRFICGLFTPHLDLERELAEFLGTEAALTFSSAWAANEATIPALCDPGTWILSDELNHASIVDAIRLSRPTRKVVYPHADVDALEAELAQAPADARRLVISDGVFSMEGDLAPLPALVAACRRHDAILVLDDSHGTGVLGPAGRGTAEHFGLAHEVDVTVSTLGKALGGAAGGFVAASQAVCEMLEQRARPQLFSNALAPSVACSARAALGILRAEPERVARIHRGVARLRERILEQGLKPLGGDSGIVPVLVGDTALAIAASASMLESGVFATGFGYPVVPEGTARVRLQVSAAHEEEQLDRAAAAIGRAVSALTAADAER